MIRIDAVWLAAMLHNPALEAKRWASSGHINLARAQWVAGNLRPLGRRQAVQLQRALAEGDLGMTAVRAVQLHAQMNPGWQATAVLSEIVDSLTN